jgi:pantoate--beta-alanine ligase
MLLSNSNRELAAAITKAKESGKTIGLIPTMGALHEGHLSLVRKAQQDGHFVVVSIFVNPLQFNQPADYESYPRSLGVDARLLTDAGVDLLYAPAAQEIYPTGFRLREPVVGRLGEKFEGEARPGHFAGMLTVVSRLFDLVRPDAAYFGQKDAQQLALVKQLVSEQIFEGYREPMQVVACPTVRDEQGLALSSRNQQLTEQELGVARTIVKALLRGNSAAPKASDVIAATKAELSGEARLEYLELVNPTTFEKVESSPGLLIIAARIGETRLIDNLMIGED